MRDRKRLPVTASFRVSEKLKEDIRHTAYQLSLTESQFIRLVLQNAVQPGAPRITQEM
jgi:antitoxin component of RelBE/YafQ-DinJ toxin-antitoxin module